uniref:Uncharacterized protein n=1 Tax=Arundo donax TaxID=35708 RepID=A0A0A9D6A5_ARUDO
MPVACASVPLLATVCLRLDLEQRHHLLPWQPPLPCITTVHILPYTTSYVVYKQNSTSVLPDARFYWESLMVSRNTACSAGMVIM